MKLWIALLLLVATSVLAQEPGYCELGERSESMKEGFDRRFCFGTREYMEAFSRALDNEDIPYHIYKNRDIGYHSRHEERVQEIGDGLLNEYIFTHDGKVRNTSKLLQCIPAPTSSIGQPKRGFAAGWLSLNQGLCHKESLVRRISLVILSLLLFGCAQGRVDVLDDDGNVVGYCSADFNFHWHGAQDSVNYILYLCAKEHIDKGFRISDESILANDYTTPKAPEGKSWSKKLAKEQFSRGLISEEKLGYILASVEFRYWKKMQKAKGDLSRAIINKEEYKKLVEKARAEFEGA